MDTLLTCPLASPCGQKVSEVIDERLTESFQILQRDRNSKGGELFESPQSYKFFNCQAAVLRVQKRLLTLFFYEYYWRLLCLLEEN